FPGQDAGCSAQTGCCVPEATRIFTPPDFTNAAYDCPPGSGNGCVSSDHRPLSAALAKADQALPQSNNPRFIVLVTDGAPQGNCALPDDCNGAQNELTTLQNHGIRPVVILRLGDGTGDCLLN